MPIIPLGIGSRIRHPEYGVGVVTGINAMTYDIVFVDEGLEEIKKDYDQFSVIERMDVDNDLVSFFDIEMALTRILRKWSDPNELVTMGNKWEGGTMILQPADKSLKGKEIPIEGFFHKIVMVRDRLRVMEQRINASKNMSDEEKVNLQQYITRIYGSLTSFNILFKSKDDSFVGEGRK